MNSYVVGWKPGHLVTVFLQARIRCWTVEGRLPRNLLAGMITNQDFYCSFFNFLPLFKWGLRRSRIWKDFIQEIKVTLRDAGKSNEMTCKCVFWGPRGVSIALIRFCPALGAMWWPHATSPPGKSSSQRSRWRLDPITSTRSSAAWRATGESQSHCSGQRYLVDHGPFSLASVLQ